VVHAFGRAIARVEAGWNRERGMVPEVLRQAIERLLQRRMRPGFRFASKTGIGRSNWS
jgi:hypothetical protein